MKKPKVSGAKALMDAVAKVAPTRIEDIPTIEVGDPVVLAKHDAKVAKDYAKAREKARAARDAAQASATPRVNMVTLDASNMIVQRSIGVMESAVPADGDGFRHIVVDDAFFMDADYFTKWPRDKRDALLSASDWTQAPDIQLAKDDEWKKKWAEYRNALRDLPEKYPDPLGVIWPQRP